MPQAIRAGDAGPDVDAPEPELARAGLRVLALLAPLAVAGGALAGGLAGGLTAAAAVGLLAVWQLASALPSAWAARRGPGQLVGVALGGFALRLVLLAVAMIALRPVDAIDGPVLAVTVAVGLVALLGREVHVLMRHDEYWLVQPEHRKDRA